MSSLTDTAQGAQPMNLHSRVIKSGLDSITGPEADKILLLFSACAVFAEVKIVQQKPAPYDCFYVTLRIRLFQLLS